LSHNAAITEFFQTVSRIIERDVPDRNCIPRYQKGCAGRVTARLECLNF